MRIHKLTVSGFGPFSGKHTVDFDALSSNGLFIVSGPTGAGKTAVLDAISFALYGETTGEGQASGNRDGRSGADLRCRACTPMQPTMVAVEFSAGGKKYLAERNPEYERARERGDGVTRQAATASLKVWSTKANAWELRKDGKLSAVNAEIEQIIGLNAEQFRRVIVIPQGRFREVLVSEHADRQKLLQRIFDTEVYERFELVLKDRANKAEDAMKAVKQRLDAVLADQPWATGMPGDDVAKELATKRDAAETALRAATAALDAIDKQRDKALAERAAAIDLAGLVERSSAAQAKLAKCRASVEHSKDRRAELKRARAAAEPMRAIKVHDAAERQLTERKAAVPEAKKAVADAKKAEAAARKELAEATKATDEISKCDTRIGKLTVTRAEELKKASERDKTRRELEALVRRVAGQEQAVLAKKAEAAAATKSVTAARTEAEDAREAFIRGTAARLAGELKPNCPCPVCGSKKHPSPVEAEEDVPDAEALESLEAELAEAEQDRDALKEAHTAAALELQKLKTEKSAKEQALAALAEPKDIGALDEEVSKLQRKVSALKTALSSAQSSHDRATKALQASSEMLARVEQDEAGCKAALESAATALAAAMQAGGFSDARAVLADARTEREMDEWAAKEAAEDRDLTAAESAAETLKTQVNGRVAPDVTALEARCNEVESRRNIASQKRDVDRAEHQRLKGILTSVQTILQDRTGAEAEQRELGALRDFVLGDTGGGERISLHAWVLGAVLEQVVQLATLRMRHLTKGRYDLVRAEGTTDRRANAGLDIEVLDSFTGTRRAARTLSGGETFLASLSLALALAEVAESRQGGRRLETVFIDEGFGTLDTETLDLAMNALCSMQQQGRVVGVISHVEEMKRQIAVQLQVSRDAATGESSLKVVGV